MCRGSRPHCTEMFRENGVLLPKVRLGFPLNLRLWGNLLFLNTTSRPGMLKFRASFYLATLQKIKAFTEPLLA